MRLPTVSGRLGEMLQLDGAASKTAVLPSASIMAENTIPPPLPVSPTLHNPPAEHAWGTTVVVVVGAKVVVVAGTHGDVASLKIRIGLTWATWDVL